MTYEIKPGTHSDSIEIYFDGKPSQDVRDALKALRFRWHNLKKCWYGFATETAAREAILTACDGGDQVVTDGYLGGGAVYGGNSLKYLHGADLAAAIRADLKKMGIKGATISCKTYAGGQSITATVKYTPADLVPLAQYVEDYRIKSGMNWIETAENPAGIHVNTYYNMTAEEQEATRKAAAEYHYKHMTEGAHSVNQYYISDKSGTNNPERTIIFGSSTTDSWKSMRKKSANPLPIATALLLSTTSPFEAFALQSSTWTTFRNVWTPVLPAGAPKKT